MMYFLEDRIEQLNTLIAQYQQLLFIEEQKLLNTKDNREISKIEQETTIYKQRLRQYLEELRKLTNEEKPLEHLATKENNDKWHLEEYFRANQRGWWEDNKEIGKAAIKGGVYAIEAKADKTLFFTILTEANFEQDYELEAQITYIKGEGNNGFGLCWGDREINDVLTFEISNTGSTTLRKLENNKTWRSIEPWTTFHAIYEEGIPNVLRVFKKGNQITCNINEQIVFESAHAHTKGKDIGFVTQTVMKIVVNYIKFRNL